jgi:hypothetical protein
MQYLSGLVHQVDKEELDELQIHFFCVRGRQTP